jgi:hypothetical protein
MLLEAETLIIGGAGLLMLEVGLVFEMFGYVRFSSDCGQSMYCYNESAIVRIKWGKAFSEHIKNHRLMQYASKMEILPH